MLQWQHLWLEGGEVGLGGPEQRVTTVMGVRGSPCSPELFALLSLSSQGQGPPGLTTQRPSAWSAVGRRREVLEGRPPQVTVPLVLAAHI